MVLCITPCTLAYSAEGLRMHYQHDAGLLRRLCTSSQSMLCLSLSPEAPVAHRIARCAASIGSCGAGMPEHTMRLRYLCMHPVLL